jgi:hypothetical protein
MSTQVQYRRGTATQNNAFTGALAEITVDTTNLTLRVHDGVTAGGSNLATVTYVNNEISSLSANSITDGNSNVKVYANGNVAISVQSVANTVIFTNAGVEITGTINVTGNIVAGNISGNTISGEIGTATQPNITSVGTLTSLSVTGNIITSGNISGNTISGQIGTATQPNITSVGTLTDLSVTGNITGANINGNGSGLASITGANVTGTVGSATFATSASTAGTVTTNAQANITSVGTLSSLSVSGNTTSGNLITAGTVSATGNVTSGNLTTSGVIVVSGTGDSSISGNLNMNSKNITSVANPVNAQDAATKTYVDTLVASGIHFHEPVRVESPINLVATYDNGTDGVGATLTNSGTQAALVIDGVTVSAADRVLIYEQTDETQNGIYVVTDVGSVSTNWVLTRSADADTYVINSADGLSEGSSVFVQEGDTGAGELYTCNTTGVITFGTTNITFVQISSAQIYSAGAGLALAGTTFSITVASPINVIGITNANANGVGNIGAAANTFDTVFARATSAQYADLAEIYRGDQVYEPGTVLVFGGTQEVTTSNVSHDIRIAGVVSTAPAYLMNNQTSGVAVALTGRVPCRVRGPVAKGEQLVNINTGIAGAIDFAQYRPGCVIGKSLESIADSNVHVIEIAVGRY